MAEYMEKTEQQKARAYSPAVITAGRPHRLARRADRHPG